MKRFLKPKLVVALVMATLLVSTVFVCIPRGARVHAASGETLTAPFANGPNGATTTNSYSGSVTISVSGFGQASATQCSDAFYIYTDNSNVQGTCGNPITPEHNGFGLCINNHAVDNYVTAIPPYSSSHMYQFTIALGSSPQQLTFGVCDLYTSDNTGSFTITVSQVPHNQLIIFLQGITTSLNRNQANNGVIVGMGAVPDTLKNVFPAASTKPNANTRFLEYSYLISRTDNGLPGAYNCADTITNSLLTDILLLDKQIKNAFKVEPAGAQVDIYLVGHSLGGVVALGYLDFLEQKLGVSLPSGAHLKSVITLDSPIGGVAKGFLTDFSALGGQILVQNCPAAKGQPLTAPKDLETIFGSSSSTTPPEPEDSGTNPQGSQASALVLNGGTLPTPIPSNESLVENAQTDLGTSSLSIGNLNDFLFDPHACARALPSFLDTMFLEDDGDGSGVYGRDFVSGPGTCPGVHNIKRTTQIVNTNHTAVLSDGNVQIGIKNFLTPLASGNVGGTPNPLPVNPFQSPDS